MIPAPYIYLLALGLGAIVGAALNAWLGWPWWAVALAFFALVWLAFMSTAFIGPPRGPRLRDDLLDTIDPSGRWNRQQREDERLIRNCPFPLFGLDSSWTGLRFIGGTSDDGKSLSTVQLAFGDHFSTGPWLRVGTGTLSDGFDLRYWAIELWRRAARPPSDLPPDQWSAWVDRRIDERLTEGAHWSKASIPVDGHRIDFDRLEEADDWVARAVVGDLVVTIEGHRFDVESVRLVTVDDVEPYIEGSRRFFQEERRRDE